MNAVNSHPERLLLALDEALDHEVRLILYGRSAIWLGYSNPPPAAATTKDVDAIIPAGEVQAFSEDLRFWDARDAVNARFKSEQLYITHLFPETEVFLRQEWLQQVVPIHPLAVEASATVPPRNN